jgi:hypothetical protein
MVYPKTGSVSSAGKPSNPDLLSAANEESIRIFQETEHICRRLEDRKCTDPAVTRSIHQLAKICKITIQECKKVVTYDQSSSQRHLCSESPTSEGLASQRQPPSSTLSIQDASRLKDLIDECHRKTADVVALLDHVSTQATEEYRRKTACRQQQNEHMVDIFDTLSTLTMTRAGSIWKGATPHTRPV